MKELHITMTRIELNWLYRQLEAGKDKAEGYILKLQGPQSEDKAEEIGEAVKQRDYLLSLCSFCKDALDYGERQRAKLAFMRTELEEARELVGDNENALTAIRDRIDALPKEEPYKITVDRPMVKFILKLIENDLHKFRSSIIPKYESSSEEDFKDVIQTKTFWINKARKSKDVLDALKSKLEGVL